MANLRLGTTNLKRKAILTAAPLSRRLSSVSHLREKNIAIRVSQVERGGSEGDCDGTSDGKSFLAMSDVAMPPFRVKAAFGPGRMLNMTISTDYSLEG